MAEGDSYFASFDYMDWAPCGWCGEYLKGADLHQHCEQRRKEFQERSDRWTTIVADVDMDKMDEYELRFLENTIRPMIMKGVKIPARLWSLVRRMKTMYPRTCDSKPCPIIEDYVWK